MDKISAIYNCAVAIYNFNKCVQLCDIMHEREKLKGDLTKNVTEILKLHLHEK